VSSFTEGHILQCSCDECLNRGGGIPAPTAAIRKTKPDEPALWRVRAKSQRDTEEMIVR
jgi:hypothetical protein